MLNSHEECLRDKRAEAANFRHIEEESNKLQASRLIQEVEGKYVVINAPYPPMTTEELDHSFDLPYTRLPHPRYKGKRIPAYDMIKHSVNIHRGCFGGCAFCTISAHQGKFIMSRSPESILAEVKKITQMPDFKGYISDIGAPSANMYGMRGKDESLCKRCKRPSCLHPKLCPNMNNDHSRLIDLYRKVREVKGVENDFTAKMEQPKVSVFVGFSGDYKYDIKNAVTLTYLSQALSNRYLKSIREEKGGTYGVGVSGSIDKYPVETYQLSIGFDTNEALADELIEICDAEIRKIAEEGPLADDIAKSKEFLQKNYKNVLENNGGWISAIFRYYDEGYNYKDEYLGILESVTADDVKAFAQKLLDDGNRTLVVMRPER